MVGGVVSTGTSRMGTSHRAGLSAVAWIVFACGLLAGQAHATDWSIAELSRDQWTTRP